MEKLGFSLSWKKAVLSCCIILAATVLFMMYGDQQRAPTGDGYRSSRVYEQSNADSIGGALHTSSGSTQESALQWFLDDDLFPLEDKEEATGIDPKADRINETCDTCCYHYVTINKGIVEMASEEELAEKGCQQRLPDALIFGVKKGGTTTLKNFISYHPDIAFTQSELHYFTSTTEVQKGLQYYKSKMVYSTPGQVSMEKTPAYSHYPKVPALISRTLPNVKLIIIMRDPVERAVSDFVHLQVTMAQQCPEINLHPVVGNDARGPVSLGAACFNNSKYFISDTFENSVIGLDGAIRYTNQLVSKGVYVKDIRRYLKYFKADQILALDGNAFINDPYPTVKKVESFLGIRDYFTREHFYFDVQKGFFCLTKPIPNNCMNPSKGRPHPDISEETLAKLREYYRPYNKALNDLMNVDFNWSS
ncbi:heparan sulfate glucosamine 3-O-sulfotransferase 1-like [Asterias rubens]|uniref:heparan sulfate glucosamine 3-O-sulfotransferase 1-like n=1 Tax=Asterias rubens TaxID=7604 RepID=UPI001455DB67|nr:heparan sulfate glucosamine 3-O-sulfotransferase 1-like [Asterias rubens]XP_033640371.1 heparan sulfate glucosamine 3-O-sulfotransferase 1-like [Asterias rubens]XP_033640372.1 heparan sulfate glucosamine 3-O-sulfotransferase 1-like [Asterias rubens]